MTTARVYDVVPVQRRMLDLASFRELSDGGLVERSAEQLRDADEEADRALHVVVGHRARRAEQADAARRLQVLHEVELVAQRAHRLERETVPANSAACASTRTRSSRSRWTSHRRSGATPGRARGGCSPPRSASDCLAASVVFCLRKQKVTATNVTADVTVEIVRNERRRLRIGKVEVTLHTDIPANDPALQACLGAFEDFCVVTQSVRQGIDVAVRVDAPIRTGRDAS